jgi:hypothetical protein
MADSSIAASEVGPRAAVAALPVSIFNQNRAALGAKLGDLMVSGEGSAAGAAKRLYGAMWSDLESWAANAPAASKTLFQEAVAATKAKSAQEMLGDFFTNSVSSRQGLRQVNVDGLLTKVYRGQEAIERLIGPHQFEDLVGTLKQWAKTPLTQSGSNQSNFLQREVMGTAIGAGAAAVTGNDPRKGAMYGFGGGLLMGTVASKISGWLLSSAGGRYFVRKSLESGTNPISLLVNALAQTGRGTADAMMSGGAGANGGAPMQMTPYVAPPQAGQQPGGSPMSQIR